MKRFLCLLTAAVLCAAIFSCGKEPDNTVTVKSDLPLDVLCDILKEKGDKVKFSDIPPEYMAVIPNPALPQVLYPIDENTSFYIIQTSETTFYAMLAVKKNEEQLSFSGAQEIIAYIESLSAEQKETT